jgi:hypothetical protein
MKAKHLVWRAAALALVVMMILSGCSTPATSTLVPTIDLQPTFDAVAAEAAKTVIAGLTQNAPTAAPVVPTATLAPSSTPLPTETALPTFTPVPPTATLRPWTATPAVAPTSSYNCTVTEQSPIFGADFDKNAPFDGNWTVKNTSSTTWSKDQVDFKYLSGTKFQDNTDGLDLKSDVAKDGTYKVVIDMTAPKTPGRYSATWAFVSGSNILCPVNVTIDVK